MVPDQPGRASLAHVLSAVIAARQFLAAGLGPDLRQALLRIAAASSGTLAALSGYRNRALARVSAFDKHLAEACRRVGPSDLA